MSTSDLHFVHHASLAEWPVQWTPALQTAHQRLANRYPLAYHSLHISNNTLHSCTVSDPDALFDALMAKGEAHADVQDERMPYWAELWPAALGLIDYLDTCEELSRDHQVLELGAGLGLVGQYVAQKGIDTWITDYLPEAVEMAQFLVHVNGLSQARVSQLDWRYPDPTKQVDWILAADVAYEARSFEPLLTCFRKMLRPGGRVLISEPGRAIAEGWLKDLLDQRVAVPVMKREVDWLEIPQQVGVYQINWESLTHALG